MSLRMEMVEQGADSKMASPIKRECLCELCNQEYPVWYADNALWNAVMRYPDGKEASEKTNFVCINCFVKEADRLGIEHPAWRLTVE